MARVFMYEYLGDAQSKTVVEDDPEERVQVPEKGEIVVRNGIIWRVLCVTFTQHEGPTQSSQCPLEVRIRMARIRSGLEFVAHK